MNHRVASAPARLPLPGADEIPVAWRLHREMVLLAGWGRAILLQLANPLVAEGVAAHSGFRRERGNRIGRLARTLHAMLALTFGTPDEAAAVASRIVGIHDRVHGTLPSRAGVIAAGVPYSAHDPALLTWVHATLVDSLLRTYELFVAPLTDEERDRYCEESCAIEPLLGIPAGSLPRTVAALSAYVDEELASGRIVVTDTARDLGRDILNPPALVVGRPLLWLARLPTVGLLPHGVRLGYGLVWGPGREGALRRLAATSRRVLPWLPPVLRHWPAARRAFARARYQRRRT